MWVQGYHDRKRSLTVLCSMYFLEKPDTHISAKSKFWSLQTWVASQGVKDFKEKCVTLSHISIGGGHVTKYEVGTGWH